MTTRIFTPLVLALATLGGCCTPSQVGPAIDTASLLNDAFVAEQTNTRAYVESGNPDPTQFAAFTAAQGTAYVQFSAIYRTHLEHLASMTTIDPAAAERIALLIEGLKRD